MSINISFPHGQYRRWSLYLSAVDRVADEMPRFVMAIEDPSYTHRGMLIVRPGDQAYDEAWAADWHGGGVQRMEALLSAAIEAIVEMLAEGDSERMPAIARPRWQQIVDLADHARAEFYAKYPDGQAPAFEVVHELAYDRRTGELVAAR